MPEIFVFSKKVWDKLPALDRQLIRKASALTVGRERKLWAAREKVSLDRLKKRGINVIMAIDKGPFIKATAPVRAKFGSKYADLIKRIQAIK